MLQGPNGLKGMRYSNATIQYSLYLASIAGGESKINKLNDLHMLRLPGGLTLKLKKFEFNHGAGASKQFYMHLKTAMMHIEMQRKREKLGM